MVTVRVDCNVVRTLQHVWRDGGFTARGGRIPEEEEKTHRGRRFVLAHLSKRANQYFLQTENIDIL